MDEKTREKLLSCGVRRIGRALLDKLQAAYADMRPESMFALTALAYWKKLEELHILSVRTCQILLICCYNLSMSHHLYGIAPSSELLSHLQLLQLRGLHRKMSCFHP